MHRMKKLSVPILAAILFSGCIQHIALESISGIMDNGFTVVSQEQDLRIAEQSIASNLKLLEAVLMSDSENTHDLLLASMGYSSYAIGFAEDDSIDRARMLYLRGKEFGMRILRQHSSLKMAMEGNAADFKSALQQLTKEDAPAVFWTAVGWGGFVRLTLTDPNAIVDLPKIEAMMRFVIDKDPDYFYGGAYFFLATLDGSRPNMLGGNLDESKRFFEECLRINKGKFLMSFVYYAWSYAVQTQDRPLFDRCLTRVDTTSIDILPEARLSNAIAKKKARLLRERADQLF